MRRLRSSGVPVRAPERSQRPRPMNARAGGARAAPSSHIFRVNDDALKRSHAVRPVSAPHEPPHECSVHRRTSWRRAGAALEVHERLRSLGAALASLTNTSARVTPAHLPRRSPPARSHLTGRGQGRRNRRPDFTPAPPRAREVHTPRCESTIFPRSLAHLEVGRTSCIQMIRLGDPNTMVPAV